MFPEMRHESYYMLMGTQIARIMPISQIKEQKILPRQKNTWVVFGTGKAPSA